MSELLCTIMKKEKEKGKRKIDTGYQEKCYGVPVSNKERQRDRARAQTTAFSGIHCRAVGSYL